jgi:hydroxymethylglutaryl-CoA reductase (NADPH)
MTPSEERELPRIPREPGADHAPGIVARRRALCEDESGAPLPYLAGAPVPTEVAAGNIENMIGYAQVPVGIAGPMRVDTSDGPRTVYVPMATNEGALVASYSRGMRLLNESGGVWARVVREGLSQHPILVYESGAEALRAAELARAGREEWAALTAEGTRHGALVGVEPEVIGRRLVLRLVFTTGDAVGINMAAAATDRIARALAGRSGARAYYVHGQDVEKRANARAFVEGRGRSVVAEAVVPRAVLAAVARVTPEDLVAIARSYATGYAQLGTQNWLVQAANGLAAVLLACGQDVAYVTECATGQLDLELAAGGDLHVSVTLPSLLVGTVGGGTGKGTAAECLAILDCAGDGAAKRFAEIIGATVLAGDLSLMSAFCAHEFVAAHEALGRNRPAPAGG